VSFVSPGQDGNRDELLQWCEAVHAVEWGGPYSAGADKLPFLVHRRATERMRNRIKSLAAETFDAIFLEQVFLAPYLGLIQAPTILNEHNIESTLLRQAVACGLQPFVELGVTDLTDHVRLLRIFEDEMWPRFSVRTAVSEQERREIQQRAGTGRTLLAENGTDLDLWLPHGRHDTNTLLFMGSLKYYPNIDAILHFWSEIWPHVRRRRPSCRLIVAGREADRAICELAGEPGFTLVENPMDIRTVAGSASVSIAPLRVGAGSRLKILDSMALGLPVVSTAVGCGGLAVDDGEHLMIRDDPRAFADAIVDVLCDARTWNRLRENGRRLVEQRYSWETTLKSLDEALRIVTS
jgi:glycosyltransferase involved in cell wall biosynthesis